MKIKYVYILVLGLLLLFSSTANAVGITNKISLFNGSIVLNNMVVQLKENPLIIYNEKAYVPLRAIAQTLGGVVGYNKENRSIYIDQPSLYFGKSEINQKVKNEEFTLSIFSKNATYNQGESIQVWSHLLNESDQPITISHGEPLVGYNIQEESGFEVNQIYAFSLNQSSFNPGDEFSSQLLPLYIVFYNSQKQGVDLIKYLTETDRPSLLPKGKYTITAEASYFVGKDPTQKEAKRNLKASISITIV
ncbi:copper amine oxidase-like protein [Cohnella lupini]|uniref:Copper amine oxidase-like protein n=2 Tax=Cohnella lupini TaxID=1294267 RepID=A0A3D9HQ74_9BACL|nr:copper amine oxidase-like protein [Cohnella lupini]